MPPQGAAAADAAAADALRPCSTSELDRAAAAQPNPGRPLLHRLNRVEYANAIRDLLALDVDVASLLPPDDSSVGFDNIADVLGVSPVLLERYLAAACGSAPSRSATIASPPAETSYPCRGGRVQAQHIEGLPLGTRGGMVVQHTFPVDGEYVIKPTLWRNNVGPLRGLEHPAAARDSVDGGACTSATVGTPEEHQDLVRRPGEHRAMPDSTSACRCVLPITAGPHEIGVTFVAKTAAQEPRSCSPFLQPARRRRHLRHPAGGHRDDRRDRSTSTGRATRRAAARSSPAGQPAASLRGATRTCACARTIMPALARRAYRRPATDADVQRLLTSTRRGRARAASTTGVSGRAARVC